MGGERIATGSMDTYAMLSGGSGAAVAAIRAGHSVSVTDTLPLDDRGGAFGILAPVNLYGELMPFRQSEQTIVVEDAAQSHGLRPGCRPGSNDMTCYSFYPSKNLGAAGQAGALVTNNPDVAAKVRVLRDHGEEGGRFVYPQLSGNYRMDELQAAILRAKLPHLADWTYRRQEIARRYNAAFLGQPRIKEPKIHAAHVFHIYAVSCD
ncbi:hypothetical protein LCGC14_1669800, partial [marine sediment metagenome]